MAYPIVYPPSRWFTESTSTHLASCQQDTWEGWNIRQATNCKPLLTFSNATTTLPFPDTSYTMTATANQVWDEWQAAPMTITVSPSWAYTRTPEQVQAAADRAQQAREEASRRHLAAQHVAAQAQDRAMVLLLSLLTPDEMTYYLTYDQIKVRSQRGNLYVIEKRGVHGNIFWTDEHGCKLGRICVAPKMYDDGRALPLADGWVGQYLMLKHDEDLIVSTGNWSERRPCLHPDVPIIGREAVAA